MTGSFKSNFASYEFNIEEEEHDPNEDRILIHLDIDYFFAQVEILKQPDLKNKPVIVGNPDARETGRGVVLTCTYEARKYGVHSGLPMKIALDRCPQAIIVQSSYSEYRVISKKIMNLLLSFDVPMRNAGIDEAYLDITSLVDNYNEAKELTMKIKKQIFDIVSLTVSIGIGPTLKIAKIGSDYQKPDGITVIPPKSLNIFFKGLDLIKIPGIGKKTALKLGKLGYKTCDQLLSKNKNELIEVLGSWGSYFYNIFRGKTANQILPRGPRKSVSHSRTFIGVPGDTNKSIEMVKNLFESSYSNLIEEKFLTKTVGLRIRFNDFETITRAKSLPVHTTDKDMLFNMTKEIISPYLEDSRGLRLIGVGFYNLKKQEESQTSLDDFETFSKVVEVDPRTNNEVKVDTTKKRTVSKTDLSDFFHL